MNSGYSNAEGDPPSKRRSILDELAEDGTLQEPPFSQANAQEDPLETSLLNQELQDLLSGARRTPKASELTDIKGIPDENVIPWVRAKTPVRNENKDKEGFDPLVLDGKIKPSSAEKAKRQSKMVPLAKGFSYAYPEAFETEEEKTPEAQGVEVAEYIENPRPEEVVASTSVSSPQAEKALLTDESKEQKPSARAGLIEESGAEIETLRKEFATARKELISGGHRDRHRIATYARAHHSFLFCLMRGAERTIPMHENGTRGVHHAAFQARVRAEFVEKEQQVLDELGVRLSLVDELRKDRELSDMLGIVREEKLQPVQKEPERGERKKLFAFERRKEKKLGVVDENGDVVGALLSWLPSIPDNVLASLLSNLGAESTLLDAREDDKRAQVAAELAEKLGIIDPSEFLMQPGDRFVLDGGGLSVYHTKDGVDKRVLRLTNQGYQRFGVPLERGP